MKRTSDMSEFSSSMLQKVALVERSPDAGGVTLVNKTVIAKKSPNDLVELAKEIQKADNFVHATAYSKLQIIAEQMRFLQQQAQKVLLEAKTNADLHHCACNFVKVPGHIYHLYQRQSGQKYFGMVSPEEWTNCPHTYLGSFRLEQDHSWTPIEDLRRKDNELQIINNVLSTNADDTLSNALQYTHMETS